MKKNKDFLVLAALAYWKISPSTSNLLSLSHRYPWFLLPKK
ncbi:MAG TPA: hypothetical protein PKI92_01160 [Candidatus Woesebacteria bacterium]|nr:hypothetical protein [Candidatus Woesebacteria bacterium]HPR99382.1 hypothetical protein [Candidatus Woesebacteria bacterium]